MEMEDDDDPCAASLLTYARFIRRKSTAKVTLDDINEDTLHSILSRVDVESPRELLALSVVSKRFRDALRSSTVWHTLDLSAHGAQMTNKILYGIIKDDDAVDGARAAMAGASDKRSGATTGSSDGANFDGASANRTCFGV